MRTSILKHTETITIDLWHKLSNCNSISLPILPHIRRTESKRPMSQGAVRSFGKTKPFTCVCLNPPSGQARTHAPSAIYKRFATMMNVAANYSRLMLTRFINLIIGDFIMAKFKNLYFVEYSRTFCVKVGNFPCYYDNGINWQRLNLAIVRRRNRWHCPRLWTKR